MDPQLAEAVTILMRALLGYPVTKWTRDRAMARLRSRLREAGVPDAEIPR